MRSLRPPGWTAGLAVAALLTFGCATEAPLVPEPVRIERTARPGAEGQATAAERPLTQPVPTPPAPGRTDSIKPEPPAPPRPEGRAADLRLIIENERLATFIQLVYGTILKRNFMVDPAVQARQDLVTVRTSEPQTADQIDDIARKLLKSYGVAVMDIGGGVLRIVPDTAQTAYLPELRRGRALPDTPMPMRPVFHLVEMSAVRNSDVSLWLKSIFGARLTLQDDPNRNAILISGPPDDVRAALQAIEVLDQPALRGRQGIRINPSFLASDEMAKRLGDLLTAQGYIVGGGPAVAAPVVFVPVPAINALFAFAVDEKLLKLVENWAREIDSSRGSATGTGFVSYQVKNTDATALAKVLHELIGGAAAAPAAGQPATAGSAARRVVVNPATNTLIIAAAGIDASLVLSLLRDLDRPARAAVIEVTVAEVRLSDTFSLGVEFGFDTTNSSGNRTVGGTIGSLIPTNPGGLLIRSFNSANEVRVVLNALASNNKARILSSPSVLARNGESATIQVGEEVPIVTSQQTSGTGTTPGQGVTTGVLQTIQYRNTGVILRVRPTIFSDDRVDLEVAQEVSAARSTTTGVSISPTFSSRKVETRLSLRDGSTVMLAGLISTQEVRGDSGVPWLKDIPGLGQLFKQDTRSDERTELIVLITPYVVSDDGDARAVTEAFRTRLAPWSTKGIPGERLREGQPAPQPAPPPASQQVPPTSPQPAPEPR